MGIRPLDFPTAIIVLTAVHFHVAGFGLLGYAALRTGAADGPSWIDRLAAGATFGLVVGMPVTAAGFVLPSTAVNALGALMVGVSGIAVAIVAVVDTRRTVGIRRLALILASACLLGGMPLGIARAAAPLLDVTFLDLESMVRTHGLLNAVAVVILVHVPVVGPDPGEEAHSTR